MVHRYHKELPRATSSPPNMGSSPTKKAKTPKATDLGVGRSYGNYKQSLVMLFQPVSLRKAKKQGLLVFLSYNFLRRKCQAYPRTRNPPERLATREVLAEKR